MANHKMQEMDLVTEIKPRQCDNIYNKRFNFGSKYSRLHICAVLVFLFSIIAFVVIQLTFCNPSQNSFESETKNLSKEGHYDNHTHIKNENIELDPCDDFYKFACQDWQEKNRKPEKENHWTVFAVQYYKINKLVIDILEEPIQDNEMEALLQAKRLYRKCLAYKMTLQSILKGTIGQTGYPAVNELCKDSLKNIFSIALAHKMAVVKYGDTEQLERMKYKVQEMFDNIKSLFHDMDTHSLSTSIDKTKLCVGLPDWIFNRTRVQAEYNELYLDTNGTFSQQLDAAKYWLRKTLAEKKLTHNSDCPWTDSLGYDGAYYLRSKNLIYLPLGLLELPYLGQHQSESQNYGALGSIIGHELSHAYLVPNANKIDESILSCFQSQYSTFTANKLKGQNIPLNFDLTMHENLADNLGLTASFNAFLRIGILQDRLDDINQKQNQNSKTGQLTDEQLFFLSFAQKWCELPSESITWQDEHSSGKLRVLRPLQNSAEFARAWSCPIGSAMNPSPSQHQKCQLVF